MSLIKNEIILKPGYYALYDHEARQFSFWGDIDVFKGRVEESPEKGTFQKQIQKIAADQGLLALPREQGSLVFDIHAL